MDIDFSEAFNLLFEDERIEVPKKINISTTNCKNCGAPLNHNHCDYCGTSYRIIEKAKSLFPVDEITLNIKAIFDINEDKWITTNYIAKSYSKHYKEQISIARLTSILNHLEKNNQIVKITKEKQKYYSLKND